MKIKSFKRFLIEDAGNIDDYVINIFKRYNNVELKDMKDLDVVNYNHIVRFMHNTINHLDKLVGGDLKFNIIQNRLEDSGVLFSVSVNGEDNSISLTVDYDIFNELFKKNMTDGIVLKDGEYKIIKRDKKYLLNAIKLIQEKLKQIKQEKFHE